MTATALSWGVTREQNGALWRRLHLVSRAIQLSTFSMPPHFWWKRAER
jgi:hypothetical protein